MQRNNESYRESHASDGYGDFYAKTYEKGYYAYQWDLIEKPLLENILGKVKLSGAKDYLDFACGTGRILSVGERVFNRAIGVDISESMLKVARINCKNSNLIERDITKFPLEKKFDVITSFRFFLNAEKGLASSVLNTLRKNLNDGGTLIVNVHVNKYSLLGFAYRIRNALKNEVIANTLSYAELKANFEHHGFSVVEVIWYGYFPRTGWYFGWLSKKLMLPIERVCQKLPFISRTLSQSFIVICKKV